jgi:hypothetical protein
MASQRYSNSLTVNDRQTIDVRPCSAPAAASGSRTSIALVAPPAPAPSLPEAHDVVELLQTGNGAATKVANDEARRLM